MSKDEILEENWKWMLPLLASRQQHAPCLATEDCLTWLVNLAMHPIPQVTTGYLKIKILRWRIAKGSLSTNSPNLLIELNRILSRLWRLGYRMYNFQDSLTSPSPSSFPSCNWFFPFYFNKITAGTCPSCFLKKNCTVHGLGIMDNHSMCLCKLC